MNWTRPAGKRAGCSVNLADISDGTVKTMLGVDASVRLECLSTVSYRSEEGSNRLRGDPHVHEA
jgi:hypothetical protein